MKRVHGDRDGLGDERRASASEAALQPRPHAGRLTTRTRPILGMVVVAALLGGCSPRTVANPNYCDEMISCKDPTKICDASGTHTCVSRDGGADASAGGHAGGGGTTGGTGGIPAGPDGGGGGTGGSSSSGGGTAGGSGTGGASGGSGTGGGAGVDAGADRPTDASDGAIPCPVCSGATPVCDTTTHTCVGCLLPTQCAGTTPVCDTTTHTCVGCLLPTQCAGATPVCDTTTKTCVGCLLPTQCAGTTPVCDTTTKTCVGCLMNSQCTAAKPICNTTTKTCGPCTGDPQCLQAAPSTPHCQVADGTCVQCNVKMDCAATAATPACFQGKCVGCTLDSECSGAKPVCDMTTHACVACSTDAQCVGKNPEAPACIKTAGAAGVGSCVACTAHSHCDKAAAKPVCVANVCAACTSDKQCVEKGGADPGVCMFHTDGHCATATEVLYVKPDAGCTDTGSGTAAAPYCAPQSAIAAATASKNVIVIRKGTLPLVNWSFAGAAPVSVIGQGGATVGPVAGIGITVTAGELYVRGLGVSGMSGAGISVSSGATVKLDGCIVTTNGGGLVVNGGGFEINNSVFAANLAATAPVAFGGVYLKSAAGKPAVFRNNTIYANGAVGLVCDGTYPVRGLLVANNTGGQVTSCDFSDTSSFVGGMAMTVEPRFDTTRPYHLTADSPCVDVGNTTDFSTHDIDGNPRPSPAGGRSDCGAHELQK